MQTGEFHWFVLCVVAAGTVAFILELLVLLAFMAIRDMLRRHHAWRILVRSRQAKDEIFFREYRLWLEREEKKRALRKLKEMEAANENFFADVEGYREGI